MEYINIPQGSTVLVWHQGQAVNRYAFAHAARQLAECLPPAAHVINLCKGRFSFMLGLAAAALRQQVTLLPPNQTPVALTSLQRDYADVHLLDDACLKQIDLPAALRAASAPALSLPAEQLLAILFTSGSTGVPQPQPKTWRTLAQTGWLDAQRFAGAAPINLVATVPAQHMFGLQTTVLLPLMSDCAIADRRPFFPADIRQALFDLPVPRALIITPTHLRSCLASKVMLPEMQFILSATAPMPLELAQQAEARWGSPVLEIYGSTEAGTIATRRTTAGEAWQLLSGATLQQDSQGTLLEAAHLPAPVPLSDHVELLSAREFRLLGRAGEQLKIAGKRALLSELNHALLQIPGIVDGVIFLPDAANRTVAIVVSDLPDAQILDALMQCIDPVFLPRPLLRVTQLPRNEVGKLTRAALHTALQAATSGAP